MRETIIIAHPCFEEGQSFGKRVATVAEELIILHADSCERVSALSKEYNCSMVLIDSTLCFEKFSDLLLPEEALLLIIHPEHIDQNQEHLAGLPWICDVIAPSVTSAELQRKLRLFIKLHRVSRDLEVCQGEVSSLTERINHAEQSLTSHQHYLDMLAERDGLTGLYNRKNLTEVLQQELTEPNVIKQIFRSFSSTLIISTKSTKHPVSSLVILFSTKWPPGSPAVPGTRTPAFALAVEISSSFFPDRISATVAWWRTN